jgi:NADH-quinone oxidoreductase subunit J
MVLFLFVVMLLNAPVEGVGRGAARLGAVLSVALGAELVWALTVAGGESGPFAGGSVSSVQEIGHLLFTTYAFQFEVTSVLILVAMVGAVVLARRDPKVTTDVVPVTELPGSEAAGQTERSA